MSSFVVSIISWNDIKVVKITFALFSQLLVTFTIIYTGYYDQITLSVTQYVHILELLHTLLFHLLANFPFSSTSLYKTGTCSSSFSSSFEFLFCTFRFTDV